jgi:hypothetical protein
LGVLAANNIRPFGDIVMGRTAPLSNSMNDGPPDDAETELRVMKALLAATKNRAAAANPISCGRQISREVGVFITLWNGSWYHRATFCRLTNGVRSTGSK